MNKEINEIIESKELRKNIAYNDNMYFFFIYLNNYVKYNLGKFQEEIFKIINNDKYKLVVITAFRGSAKSTIITLSYALWSILGKDKKKFVLIVSKTQDQSKLHFKNIISEVENNELLKNDFNLTKGNIKINQKSIHFKKLDATIKCVSFKTSIRGMRHKESRPDLTLCDDIEDLDSVRSIESRDKIEKWFTSEIIPLGDKDTKIILVGNLLHRDSLIMRIKDKISNNQINGFYREYPLVKDGKITWRDKFNSKKEIEELRKSIGNDVSFEREYMLNIIPDDTAIIEPEWVHYYDEITSKDSDFETYITGVDPAISEKTTADFTGIVTIKCFRENEKNKIYVMPDIINKRMKFPDTIKKLKDIKEFYEEKNNIIIENNGYQQAIEQQLKSDGVRGVESYSLGGKDKRTRLNMIANYIKEGNILFPKEGSKELIDQILDFGSTKHDDIVDALTIACIYFISEYRGTPHVWVI